MRRSAIIWLTFQMSHDGSGRDPCSARGVTDPGVGSGALLGAWLLLLNAIKVNSSGLSFSGALDRAAFPTSNRCGLEKAACYFIPPLLLTCSPDFRLAAIF